MPAPYLLIGLNRQLRHFGIVQRGTEREIRDRQRVSSDKFSVPELLVQDLCCAMELFGALGDCSLIGFTSLDDIWFHNVLEEEDRACRVPMREVSKLPA